MHIHEFQEMMRRVYFHKDSKRGETGTFKWLLDEVKELGEALQSKDKKAIEDEFADVIAWLASLANVANVNLEKAALTKYENKCPKCGQQVCNCTFEN
ncbi:MAG: MazG nucleotide pyrophosphohydrolase domain-containing protein [Candidatus Bathyarchaeia archaeon]